MKTIKKSGIIKALAIASLLFMAISCTENITLPLDKTYAHLVVDGEITNEARVHKVKLTRSGDALNQEPIVNISNAVVTITDGTNTFNLTENPNNKGLYETNDSVKGIPGKTYTLNISKVDVNDDGVMETYSAQSVLKKIAKIDSISLMYQDFDSKTKVCLILLYGWDIGGRNFYLTKTSINNKLITDSIKEYGWANNDGYAGKYYPGLTAYGLQNNKPDEKLKHGDTVSLELDGITEEYFNFIIGFQKEYQPKTPVFSGPSANVLTNIQPAGKAVGFFAAYSVEHSSVVFK